MKDKLMYNLQFWACRTLNFKKTFDKEYEDIPGLKNKHVDV